MRARSGERDGTRVTLLFLHQRVNVRLRFGIPQSEIVCNRSRRIAIFAPNTVFCRVHWESNAYGTTLWRLAILQAGDGTVPLQQIIGVQPGAQLLLEVDGGTRVHKVLHLIDGIETIGIAPQTVAPSYWRVVHNRLLARLPVPRYTHARHAAWLRRSGQA